MIEEKTWIILSFFPTPWSTHCLLSFEAAHLKTINELNLVVVVAMMMVLMMMMLIMIDHADDDADDDDLKRRTCKQWNENAQLQ